MRAESRADSRYAGVHMPRARSAGPARAATRAWYAGRKPTTCRTWRSARVVVGLGVGARARRCSLAIVGSRPFPERSFEASGSSRRPSPVRALRRPMQRASFAAIRRDWCELIETDPTEQRQAERDPERESAVIGDVENGQGCAAGCRPAASETPPWRRRPRARSGKRLGASRPRVTTASGASQIKVASPA